jgi:membrane-associated phospholipid phosphatase
MTKPSLGGGRPDLGPLRSKDRGLEVHDLFSAALFFVFALFSSLWPDTGWLGPPVHHLARGYVVAVVFILLAALCLVLGRLDYSARAWPLRFLRQFYPQLYFGLLFHESILLSAPAAGGASHDALFAALDQAIFGFQPAREFSAQLSASPLVTELMFASYFVFFLIFILSPWISWFRGDGAEAGREMAILTGYMLVVFTFYVLFRVEGPKYYLADLKAQSYGQFRGGPFTAFLKGAFDRITLSGAAFPSSHVAGSVMVTIFIAKVEKRLLPLYLLLDLLIFASTVFIYAHWAVDILGGIAAALLLVPLFGALYAPLSAFLARPRRAALGRGASAPERKGE